MEVSPVDEFQPINVLGLVGHDLLQPTVLLLQPAQLAHVLLPDAAKLSAPAVQRHGRTPQMLAGLVNIQAPGLEHVRRRGASG
jgi:hypothetical protein